MKPRLLWGPRIWSFSSRQHLHLVKDAGDRLSVAEAGQSLIAWGLESFDSQHFGMKMGRVHSCFGTDADVAALIASVASAADLEGYEHLAVRVPSENPALVRAFQREGFFLVDTHCTLILEPLSEAPPNASICDMQHCDLDRVQEMSEETFSLSRYRWDPLLTEQGRRDLMKAWLANDFGGRAECALVCRDSAGRPLGFIACLLDKETRTASIDLIAVHSEAQGRGIAQQLIRESCRRMLGPAMRMTVETQGSNVGAHRLYFRSGFILNSTDISLHRHPKGRIPL